MQNSLLVGLSRQVALRREMDVIANNMANINTNGFKAEGVVFNDYMQTPAKANEFSGQDKNIHFVIDRGTYHNFSKGSVEQTDNPFNLALQDDNTFFVIQTKDGERYTRAGSFVRNNEGKLTTENNLPVMAEGGEISFSSDEVVVTIGKDGTVNTNQGQKGRIKVVTFNNLQALQKIGDNMYAAGDEQPQPPTSVRMMQGYIERSNISPVKEMSRMIEVTRSYSTLTNLLDKIREQEKASIERVGNLKL